MKLGRCHPQRNIRTEMSLFCQGCRKFKKGQMDRQNNKKMCFSKNALNIERPLCLARLIAKTK